MSDGENEELAETHVGSRLGTVLSWREKKREEDVVICIGWISGSAVSRSHLNVWWEGIMIREKI